MGVVAPLIWALFELLAVALAVQGSTGYNISVSPDTSPSSPSTEEGKPDIVHHERPFKVNAPSPAYQPSGYVSASPSTPLALPPIKGNSRPLGVDAAGPASQTTGSNISTLPPKGGKPIRHHEKPFGFNEQSPASEPSAPSSPTVQGIVPYISPKASQGKTTDSGAPVFMPIKPAPVVSPSNKHPQNPQAALPNIAGIIPPRSHQTNAPENKAPVSMPASIIVPVASPPRKTEWNPQVIRPVMPIMAPSNLPDIAVPTVPSILPRAPDGKGAVSGAPIFMPDAPVPVASPSNEHAQSPPVALPIIPGALPPSSHPRNEPENKAPVSIPHVPTVPVVAPPRKSEKNPPVIQPVNPRVAAPNSPVPDGPFVPPRAPGGKEAGSVAPIFMPDAPVASPSNKHRQSPPAALPIIPRIFPPSSHHRDTPVNKAPPLSIPTGLTVPAAAPPGKSERNPPTINPVKPRVTSPNSPDVAVPIVQPIPPRDPEGKAAGVGAPIFMPDAPVPAMSQSHEYSQSPPPALPIVSRILPPSSYQRNTAENKPHASMPSDPTVPAALPPVKSERNSPVIHPVKPRVAPLKLPVPVASPPSKLPQKSTTFHSIMPANPPIPLPEPPLSINRKRNEIPAATLPHDAQNQSPPANHPATKAPSRHTTMRHSDSNSASPPPLQSFRSPPNEGFHSPPTLFYRNHPGRNKINSFAPEPSFLGFTPASKQQGSIQRPHALSPLNPVSPSPFPLPRSAVPAPPAPSPSQTLPTVTFPLHKISPSGASPRIPKVSLSPPLQALPPPPPNLDCTSIPCTEPMTNTPPGSPCGCVRPMRVALQLSVELYTFFPLVSELAEEIAAGIFMKQGQIRVMGANTATQQPEKTIVLIYLVPLGEKFDYTTAFLTYQRLWQKQVFINAPLFGDYEVLYVQYPGLPPSPPTAHSNITIGDVGPYAGHDNNGRAIQPLGVDVRRKRHKNGLGGSMIAIIVLSASIAIVLCSVTVWMLLFKHRDRVCQPMPSVGALQPPLTRPAGAAGSVVGSMPSSASLSFGSSIVTYAGSAKTFSSSDIERATDNFDHSRIVGEGGFGRVYSGVLEDGTKVAVKVLKRDDQQGGREFLAEVEMLSRLHHRNLVKLIGICIEERARCLVYELIPNGSVESHLHGHDKELAPLDWSARIKIALGAARGLAYLHEDSSPRVIHRDFKLSNILLEHDFTPKVSDFGLARAAMDAETRHISTRVMGTFGYVAPEYAMTGHLLVKSDVYSYGVVLLELLTGRKPVDMTQPPGQENLAAWVRPLLTSKEGLETVVDSSLGPDYPFDSVAKVAAIASMCVQPEVSHRPFMGEVVQALKLVCNECDETKGVKVESRRISREDISIDMDIGTPIGSGQSPDPLKPHYSIPDYGLGVDHEMGLSASDLFSTSAGIGIQTSGSFRRHSSSGPLRTGKSRKLWQAMRRLARGSVSEHAMMFKPWGESH